MHTYLIILMVIGILGGIMMIKEGGKNTSSGVFALISFIIGLIFAILTYN